MDPRKTFQLSRKLKLGVGRAYNPSQLMKFGSMLFFVLAIGLGINAVRLFMNRPATTTATPQVLGAHDEATNSSSKANIVFIDYKVQKGDTLFSVSQQYNISWTTLATINNLEAPFTLKPGSTIKIPKP